MEEFEQLANWFNDRDAEWWPFLFMRPAQDRRMSGLRVLAIAVLYGAPVGMLGDVWFALMGRAEQVNPFLAPLVVTAVLFVAFRLTFARAWNRRAARLAR